MARLEDLAREVEETEGAHDSAVVAIRGLRDEIVALKSQMESPADQQKIDELVTRLNAAQEKLAAAIAANPDSGGGGGSLGGAQS